MSAHAKGSIRQILADLQAERVRTMDPAALKINIDQRQTLVDTAHREGFVKVGDKVENFTLPTTDGDEVTLDQLVADGPAVLIFFRFAGCPTCNLVLPYYDRALRPALEKLGVTLTAVSPQVPERLGEIKSRHGLGFTLATDRDNALGRRFGILYTYDEASQQAAKSTGTWIGEITGTGSWELPMPTVVVIDRDRVIRFADVSPDWLVRTEAEPIVQAARALSLAAVE